MAAILVGLVVLTARAQNPDSDGLMNLHLMPDKVADGAMCLDGTPAGFYFKPFSGIANSNKWQLFIEGGGWCYDAEDCYQRSKGRLGSSTGWNTTTTQGGMMSQNCTVNPDFCNYNKVELTYCDGNSFTGNREDPLVYNGTNMYFRGKRNLDAILETLLEKYNLRDAQEVMLTGCSAGGLSTFIHTNYVQDWLSTHTTSLKKFKAVALSGFFLDHTNIEGNPVYHDEIVNIHSISNATLDVRCVEANKNAPWKCNFAQYTYPHVAAPMMVINSAYDQWQLGCIYTAVYPQGWPNQTDPVHGGCNKIKGWTECTDNPDDCSSSQMVTMNKYITDFNVTIQQIPKFSEAGSGAFLHSCHTHCEAKKDDSYIGFKINGVSIRDALSKWWAAPTTDPASSHQYTPCLYNTGNTTERDCNPTCLL